ncbi:MAG: Virginiamycin B lyase [Fimbriimonadaceae bacterium]|nr:Virginiamycin B lyase [Fimbriimonadaceae bacterium]
MTLSTKNYSHTIALGIAIAALVAVGCGGGGSTAGTTGGGTTTGGGNTNGGTNGGTGGQGNAQVTGQLIGADGAAVAGASLSLAATGRDNETFTATSAADGTFVFDGLPSSSYTFSADIPDGSYEGVEVTVDVQGNAKVDLSMKLAPRRNPIVKLDIVAPPSDGPGGSYRLGFEYSFRAMATRQDGSSFDAKVNWRVQGGIGDISAEGIFTARTEGDGKIICYFPNKGGEVSYGYNLTVKDPTGGRALLVSNGSKKISAYDAGTGGKIRDYESGLSTDDFVGLCQGADGKIFAVDVNGRLGRLDLAGKQFDAYTSPLGSGAYDVARSDDGWLWVGVRDGIYRIDPETGVKTVAATNGNLHKVYDMQFGPDGALYVVNNKTSAYNGIARFVRDANGLKFDRFIVTEASSGGSGMRDPVGVAFADNGNMIVADTNGNRILVFTASGAFIGYGPQLAGSPGHIVFDSVEKDLLYVATTKGLARFRYGGGSNFEKIAESGREYFVTGGCDSVMIIDQALVR